MRDEKLRVTLFAKKDKNQKTYYVGKSKFPGMINFAKGVVFIIFTSEEGSEELQIAEDVDSDTDRGDERSVGLRTRHRE